MGIIGVTQFPGKAKNWTGTDFSFFHKAQNEVYIFVYDNYYDNNNPIQIEKNQLMRLEIDEDGYLTWRIIKDDNQPIILHKHDKKVTDKYFLYGVPGDKNKVFDLKIGKSVVANSND